ncbi:uncharacterized protein LOC109600053 [Aethina tumida]|uniref:uncharacterized protein LOC109600053 n=1 Tax=Aethina tumida TaxID=116153 RepID=UPI002148C121|nr:uncharacterized protein LOC109600053 [Aethina tumida]
MNRNKRKGVYYDKRKSINTQESSNPLAKLTYRELQIEAVKINLPANLSHKMLLSLIIAKNTGREDVVRLIMDDRRVRKRIKSMNEENIEAKRRKESNETTKSIKKNRQPLKILNLNTTNVDHSRDSDSGFGSFSSTSSDSVGIGDITPLPFVESQDDIERCISSNLTNTDTPSPDALMRIVDLFKNFQDGI